MGVSVITCEREAGEADGLWRSLADNDIWVDRVPVVGAKSIAEGYTEGIRRAREDVLIFTHSDVRVWSGPALWNNLVAEANKDSLVGLVGVAGAKSLPYDAVWWNAESKLGAVAHSHKGNTYFSSFGPFGRALVLDGVLLACRLSLIAHLKWWSEGFHFYDVDVTLRAHLAGYRNMVVPLPILHLSIGETDEAYDIARQAFIERHKAVLPCSL